MRNNKWTRFSLFFFDLCWQFVILTLIVLASAAKQKEQRVQEHFSEFENEDGIKLITDEDKRAPTKFEGDAMTAKIHSIKNSNHGRGKFNYKWVPAILLSPLFCHSSFPLSIPILSSSFSWRVWLLNQRSAINLSWICDTPIKGHQF